MKKVLIVILIIIAIPLIAALFISNDYTVEREVTINKPKQAVFDYIRIIKNNNYYNHWWLIDPNAKKDYQGTDGTVGFIAAWDSQNKKEGQGEQEITKITDGERVECALRFHKPFEGKALTYMTTESAGDNQTKVKWVFAGHSHYPMNIMNLCMNKILGPDLEESVGNLKSVLEKQ